MTKRTLYVHRPLLNGSEIHAWAAKQGFRSALAADDLHVTIAFSRDKLEWPERRGGKLIVTGGRRSMEKFGDAIVLRFNSDKLADRWRALRNAGASWDHPGYKPHITITYALPKGLSIHDAVPFRGPLTFGPEQFSEVKEDAADNIAEIKLRAARAAKQGLISDKQLKKFRARAA